MRLADKATLDLQEQVVFQDPLVHLDPEDLLISADVDEEYYTSCEGSREER